MKKWFIGLLLLFCVVGLWAQGDTGKQLTYSGKIGIFRPSDSDLRDAVGSTWFLIGLDAESPAAADASWVYSLEYLHKSDSGREITEVPILVTWQKTEVSSEPSLFGQPEQEYRPYLGIGVGLYYLKADNATSDSTWKTGLHILVGARLPHNTFAELRWNTIGKWHGTDCGGYSLMVGLRF